MSMNRLHCDLGIRMGLGILPGRGSRYLNIWIKLVHISNRVGGYRDPNVLLLHMDEIKLKMKQKWALVYFSSPWENVLIL
jgi:hypothetical protein